MKNEEGFCYLCDRPMVCFLIWLLGKSGNKWVLLLTVPAANPRLLQSCVCLRRVRSGRVGSGRVRGPAPTLSVFWSCCSSFSCLLVQICHIDTQQCLLHVIVRYVQTAELADLRAAKELCNSSVSGLMWSDAWCLMWPCLLPSAPGLGWGKAPQMSLSAEGGGDTFIKANRMPFGHGGYEETKRGTLGVWLCITMATVAHGNRITQKSQAILFSCSQLTSSVPLVSVLKWEWNSDQQYSSLILPLTVQHYTLLLVFK